MSQISPMLSTKSSFNIRQIPKITEYFSIRTQLLFVESNNSINRSEYA